MTDTPRTIAALQALFPDNTTGQISAQDLRDFLVTVVNYLDGVLIAPTDPLETALTIQQPVGAAADGTSPFQIFDEFGNIIHEVDYLGEITVITNGAGMLVERLTGSGNTDIEAGVIGISAGASTPDPPIYIINSGIKFQVTKAGIVIFAANAAPADGTLNAGDCALWFDKTNGASKLMVKAKQADGAVKTGQVALS
jgi:hypothetical protein